MHMKFDALATLYVPPIDHRQEICFDLTCLWRLEE